MYSHHHPSSLPSGDASGRGDASGSGDAFVRDADSATAGTGRDVWRAFASARVDDEDASNNATTRAQRGRRRRGRESDDDDDEDWRERGSRRVIGRGGGME